MIKPFKFLIDNTTPTVNVYNLEYLNRLHIIYVVRYRIYEWNPQYSDYENVFTQAQEYVRDGLLVTTQEIREYYRINFENINNREDDSISELVHNNIVDELYEHFFVDNPIGYNQREFLNREEDESL